MILNVIEATIACEAANTILLGHFPHFMVNIRVARILGEVVQFTVANVPTEKDAPYGIIHNASFLAKGLIQTDRKGAYMENPILSGRHLKFRKISGSSEAEVLQKFVAWCVKNKAEILAIVPKLRGYDVVR
jgi:hypothetical protein